MNFFKLYWHIKSLFVMLLYKIIYRSKIEFSKISIRSNLKILIDKKGKLKIGEGCFFNNNCSINVMGSLKIGKNCLFGENVKIYDHDHIFSHNDQLIKEQGYRIKDIQIGDNCWIGSDVIILKGVTIGNNTVIGAGSVVSKDVDSNVVMYQKKMTQIKRRS